MWRYFTHTNTKRYIDVLQKIVDSYNNSFHSTIKAIPAKVTIDNAAKVRATLLQRSKKIPQRSAKYNMHDLVRISREKSTFQKGYESGFTDEVFRIVRVDDYRQPVLYTVTDLAGSRIDGEFYTEELSRVGRASPKSKLKVNQILETRGRGKNKRNLVNWKNLPADYVSWISLEDTK